MNGINDTLLFFRLQTSSAPTSMEMADDYNVEEDELNMFQAQRMVQKAINRNRNK